MSDLLKPKKGGFLRPFGCGLFIKKFLNGGGPYGSPKIDPSRGSPQSDIFYHYKMTLIEATAKDRAVKHEERIAVNRIAPSILMRLQN